MASHVALPDVVVGCPDYCRHEEKRHPAEPIPQNDHERNADNPHESDHDDATSSRQRLLFAAHDDIVALLPDEFKTGVDIWLVSASAT
jgi:hypothetical protein